MRWSIVIPAYNEEDYLPATLDSLLSQDQQAKIILVDNGSTDQGIASAEAMLAGRQADYLILQEPIPGQVHALKRGITEVATELVAICDADTIYPPNYLTAAEHLFDEAGEGVVATSAYLVPEQRDTISARLKIAKQRAVLSLLPKQNHVSGAGHCFRTDVLRATGGYDAAIWPYVLKDHELMQRVLRVGRQAHAHDLWCISSERRKDRKAARWSLSERVLYHLTPFAMKDRFFHQFLARRFEARGQHDTVLRLKNWVAAESKA